MDELGILQNKMMISKATSAILRIFIGFVLGYLAAIISIVAFDNGDSVPRPILQSLVTTPFAGFVRDSSAVMVSYSLGDRKGTGIVFNLSKQEAERLGDALASDLQSISGEGRLTFRDRFDLVFLGESRLTKLKYDATTGAARLTSEGFEGLTVRDTSFLREMLSLIHQAERVSP